MKIFFAPFSCAALPILIIPPKNMPVPYLWAENLDTRKDKQKPTHPLKRGGGEKEQPEFGLEEVMHDKEPKAELQIWQPAKILQKNVK